VSFHSTVLVLFLSILLIASSPALGNAAEDNSVKTRMSQVVANDIAYLRELVRNPQRTLDTSRIHGLLEFARQPKAEPAALEVPSLDDATGAYFEGTINQPLAHVVKYQFSSEFPSFLVIPTSIRLNGWDEKPAESVPSILNRLDSSKSPYLMVHGREHEEITPDLVTGTYFRYEVKRTVIALKDKGRRYLISITVQDEPSQIGRKGLVVNDADWVYFYSGIEGVPITGLGWAKSYIYKSLVVNILFEPEPGKAQTRSIFFKWLDAGWRGINMTEHHHLIEGFQRFLSGSKAMLESPRLPTPDQLARLVNHVRNLPEQELAAKLKPYAESMERTAATNSDLRRREYAPLIKDGAYLAKATREEREATLLNEYMKAIIGKPTPVGSAPLE
jgi:hypothetical protein